MSIPRQLTAREEQVFLDAQSLVLGITSASMSEDRYAADLALNTFLADARQAGVTSQTAMSLLFASTVRWLDGAITALAAVNGQSPHAQLNDFAMELARMDQSNE